MSYSQPGLFDDLLGPAHDAEPPVVNVSPVYTGSESSHVFEAARPVRTSHAEVLRLYPVDFARLPLATSLVLGLRGYAYPVLVTTGRETYEAAREARETVLTGAEMSALAIAAENGRASRSWLAERLEERRVGTHGPISALAALGGVQAQMPFRRWELSRVLDAWGLTLERVGVGDGAAREWLT